MILSVARGRLKLTAANYGCTSSVSQSVGRS
jgi:hypothetical protein